VVQSLVFVLDNLTLSTWAATVWGKELRGVPLQVQEAALVWCMRQHNEYRNFWNSLGTTAADTPRAGNILLHIYSDGAVKLQLESNNPPEIVEVFQKMRGKGFSDMDALHAIAHVMREENWNTKGTGEAFDTKRYVEKARKYADAVIEHPEFLRHLRLP
jgi:hypothetical protein